jgi:multisubunit Na+/H+ antiporter MnhG subunit
LLRFKRPSKQLLVLKARQRFRLGFKSLLNQITGLNFDDRVESMNTPNVRPKFLVGITGNMFMDDEGEQNVREQLDLIFRYLKGVEDRTACCQKLAKLLGNGDKQLTDFYQDQLSKFPSLQNTPIAILTGLAPGVDSLAVDVAQQSHLDLEVIAALPLPPAIYVHATTFVHRDDSDRANEQRQKAFMDKVEAISKGTVYDRPASQQGTMDARVNGFESSEERDDGVDQKVSSNVESNGSPVEQFCRKWQKVYSNRVFHVITGEEVELPVVQREQKLWAKVRSGKDDACDPHYYAAGEYLATYCHLLIAVFDGKMTSTQAGTPMVVKARLQGPRQEVLPTSKQVGLPHGGPVLHLNVNKKAQAPNDSIPMLRFLHSEPDANQSLDFKPIENETTVGALTSSGGTGTGQHEDRELQKIRFGVFSRVARNLEEYNASTAKNDEAPDKCSIPEHVNLPLRSLPSDSDQTKKLVEQASFHAATSDAANRFTIASQIALRWLFLLALLAAAGLHLFAHWMPQNGMPQKGNPENGNPENGTHSEHPRDKTAVGSDAVTLVSFYRSEDLEADQSQQSDSAKSPKESQEHHQPSVVRIIAGLLSLLFVLAGLGLFAAAKFGRWPEKAKDYRAISEGMRVQFFWNLVGLGKSVSANYMHRQRSELDWIRGAIRSLSLPYHYWKDLFDSYPRQTKIALFQSVRENWLIDQFHYFNDRYKEKHHAAHAWRKLGSMFTLAGLIQFFFWWQQDSMSTHTVSSVLFLIAITAAVAASLVMVVALYLKSLKTDLHKLTGRPHKTNTGGDSSNSITQPQNALHRWFLALDRRLIDFAGFLINTADWIVATVDAPGSRGSKRQMFFHGLINFFICVAPATILAIAMLLGVSALGLIPYFPNAMHLGVIAAGLHLLFGALCVAWPEKSMDSEFAYQYNVIAALYKHAAQRLDRLTKQLIDSLENQPENSKQAEFEFDSTVREIQNFLYDVGREALDENAEWLLLHRGRPLEPVMAA